MRICDNCGHEYPAKMMVQGKMRTFYTRRYCLACSPFGSHNTGCLSQRQTLPQRREKNRAERRRNSIERVTQRRKELILRAVALKGGCCALCGYDRYIGALEFHHLDRTEKKFQIRNGNTWSWESIKAELQKCILLCANCHREVENGVTLLPASLSVAQELEVPRPS